MQAIAKEATANLRTHRRSAALGAAFRLDEATIIALPEDSSTLQCQPDQTYLQIRNDHRAG